jgi:hypothetical protein
VQDDYEDEGSDDELDIELEEVPLFNRACFDFSK